MAIKIIKRDTANIPVVIKHNWVPLDITWYTVFFTAKLSGDIGKSDPTDLNAAIKKNYTVFSDPTLWELFLSLTSSDTDVTPADYIGEIQLKTTTGSLVSTQQFSFKVLPDVTQRTV